MSLRSIGKVKTVFMEREVSNLDDIFGPMGWCPIRRRIAETSGWISRGAIQDKKLVAYFKKDTHLYVAPIPPLVTRRGGGPLKRSGVCHIAGPGLQAYNRYLTPKEIPIEDQCNPLIYYKIAWKKRAKKPNRIPFLECPECKNGYLYSDRVHAERICGNCGLTNIFDFRLMQRALWAHSRPNDVLCDFYREIVLDEDDNRPSLVPEVVGDDYEERNWSFEEPDPGGENFNFGQVIPQMEGTFIGEASLTQIKMGSPVISRDQLAIHYCPVQKKKIGNRIRKMGYIARTIWWSNPKNPSDRRWYCLKCVKALNGKKYFPTKWSLEDLNVIKYYSKLARKRSVSDYKLEIHYREIEKNRLDIYIKKYFKERNLALQRIIKDQTSCFHNEAVREDGYLRTAVLTALKAKGITQSRRSKGGRPSGKGAKSLNKICNRVFTRRIPKNASDRIEDNLHPGQYIGVIEIKFNERKIREILKEIDTQNVKSITDKGGIFQQVLMK